MDDETQASWARERALMDVTVAKLEAKYADRGLKFTVGPGGACPVQAYGHIDGMRFYFRFRHNHARLDIGPYNEEAEEAIYQRDRKWRLARQAEDKRQLDSGELSADDYNFISFLTHYEEPKQLESDPSYYPHEIRRVGHADGDDPRDVYNGYLDADEAFEMFSRVVDATQDVPKNHWIPKYLQEMLDGK